MKQLKISIMVTAIAGFCVAPARLCAAPGTATGMAGGQTAPFTFPDLPVIPSGFIIQALPLPTGQVSPDVVAMNDGGQVLGASYSSNFQSYYGVLWTAGQPPVTLPSLGTGKTTVALSLNNSGSVVGYSYPTTGAYHSFIWTKETGTSAIQIPGSPRFDFAFAINDVGLVAGHADPLVYLWQAGSTSYSYLPVPGGYAVFRGSAMNSAGNIVGDMITAYPALKHYPYIYLGGSPVRLQGLGTPLSINASNQVVGNLSDVYGSYEGAAFWDANQTIKQLATPDGLYPWAFRANSINDNGVIVGGSEYGMAMYWPDSTSRGFDLNTLLTSDQRASWTLTEAVAINRWGQIAGLGTYQGQETAFIMTPLPQLAVDANRDGTIKLASEDASDVSTVSNPFRFWMNEGVDGPGSDGEETAEPGSFATTHDYQSNRINCKRDLEDWTRLKLSIPVSIATGLPILALNDPQSGLVAQLEWSTATLQQTGTSIAGLKFVAAIDDTKNYLIDPVVADRQIAAEQGNVIGQVDAGGSKCNITAALWKTASTGALEADLLFEGMASGQGQLVVAIYKNGLRLGESRPVNVEIRHMQDLYEHWTANATDTDLRGADISPTAVHPLGAHPAPFEFSAANCGLSLPSDPEGNDYILFVHGWRMKPYERRVFAETAAKRLYQLGYRGKFGFFSWPTEWVNLEVWYAAVVNGLADPHNYDRSEVVARRSGNGPFADLLKNLRNKYGADHIHIFAHSMGNVVVSEALRAQVAGDQVAAQYVACQSAEVASAYENFVRHADGSLNTDDPSADSSLGGPDRYTYSAPIARESANTGLTAGDNYHKGVASHLSVMANFFNGGDSALSTWYLNQRLKPDHSIWPSDTAYSYGTVSVSLSDPPLIRDRYQEDRAGFTGSNQKHEIHWDALDVVERFRILGHIVQARSQATGATARVQGEFKGPETDLAGADYLFKNIHSAEFLGDTTKVRKYYQKLMFTFRLTKYETD